MPPKKDNGKNMYGGHIDMPSNTTTKNIAYINIENDFNDSFLLSTRIKMINANIAPTVGEIGNISSLKYFVASII